MRKNILKVLLHYTIILGFIYTYVIKPKNVEVSNLEANQSKQLK